VVPIIQPQQQDVWLWVAVFLAIGWAATLAYFIIRRPVKKPAAEKTEPEIRLEDSIKKLKKACAENNPTDAKDALLSWGRQKTGAANLGAIAAQSEARLRDEILQLNQVLYGKTAEPWQGKKLFQTFVENKARKKIAATDDNKLEPLYRL
jgi:hypothetical protein